MTTCPTPTKKRHKSRNAAVAARASFEQGKGIDMSLEPYLCACGSWHLGRRRKNDRRGLMRRMGLR